MKQLYHYCSNIKCFSILESKTLRMSDIQKSNDYSELELFYPKILDCIKRQYYENPFEFEFHKKYNMEAIGVLLDNSYRSWNRQFDTGEFSNFVVCFSERSDLLTQWQAYSDNAQGCCIGFSFAMLKKYCEKSNGVLRLEKVKYMSNEEVDKKIEENAHDTLFFLNHFYQFCSNKEQHDFSKAEIEGMVEVFFNHLLESIFIDSLCCKSKSFSSEKEWRIFFSQRTSKDTKFVLGEGQDLIGLKKLDDTFQLLRNKIEFTITNNDIIPFFPIHFDDFSKCPVTELWVGPRNKIRHDDLFLYLHKNGYSNTKIHFSNITYR